MFSSRHKRKFYKRYGIMFEYGLNSIADSKIFRNFSPSSNDFNKKSLKFSIDAILSSNPYDGIIRNQRPNINELQTCCVNYYGYKRRYCCTYDNFGISNYTQQHSQTVYNNGPTSLLVPTISRYANLVIDADKELLNNTVGNKRKRIWSRAVFSKLQRKGLEKRFQAQKYIMKPDRKLLAASLGLTDAQVKVWFQNRRMKWRNCKENSANKMASKKKN